MIGHRADPHQAHAVIGKEGCIPTGEDYVDHIGCLFGREEPIFVVTHVDFKFSQTKSEAVRIRAAAGLEET